MISVLSVLAVLSVHSVLGAPWLGGSLRGVFDVQGHRGGRGNTFENTLHSFAWGLIDGVTTLELDTGITKDGAVIVWHDASAPAEKCQDTKPAFLNDTDFPYVGKLFKDLSLAQVKTLNCGSRRLAGYPMQLIYPGSKISTLQEVFDFVSCADPQRQVHWNIEAKIDGLHRNMTFDVDEFVTKTHALFVKSEYKDKITFQSFDWRAIVAMKKLDAHITTSALIASTNLAPAADGISPWFAGLDINVFPGETFGAKVANAAKSLGADVLSPNFVADNSPVQDPALAGFIPFTTKEMVNQAHANGMKAKPWTVNGLNAAQQLLDWGVDGIISDYPDELRRWAQQQGLKVAAKRDEVKILRCLEGHTTAR